MKYLLVITLFIAMLLQTFSKAFIMADFYWNQKRIEQELCVNKAKPELACKGHCQLKKELEKENKKEIPQQLQEIKLFLKADPFCLQVFVRQVAAEYGPQSNDNRVFKSSASIFRPPTCPRV